MSLISIITPTHKPGPLMEITIKSVLEQTYTDWEWVVLDNSSDFYFESYLYQFLDRNPQYKHLLHKVKIFKQHYNEVNIGHLKNECVKLTSCKDNEYVLLLDHDDFLDTNTLYEIHKMSVKYPESDYITGDVIKLQYNNENNTIYSFSYTHFRDKSSNYTKFLSGDINIPFCNICIENVNDYGMRYFQPDTMEWINQICNQNFTHLGYSLFGHPRCIKKNILKYNTYKFFEGHEISEDSVQLFFITYFLKGCYIEKQLYYNIHYLSNSNSSYMPVTDLCRENYAIIISYIKTLEEYILKLYPNYNLFDNFLNKHELNIIENDN